MGDVGALAFGVSAVAELTVFALGELAEAGIDEGHFLFVEGAVGSGVEGLGLPE